MTEREQIVAWLRKSNGQAGRLYADAIEVGAHTASDGDSLIINLQEAVMDLQRHIFDIRGELLELKMDRIRSRETN